MRMRLVGIQILPSTCDMEKKILCFVLTSFLSILGRYLYPPLWLPASVVFDAVTTTDSTSGKSRGFVILDS